MMLEQYLGIGLVAPEKKPITKTGSEGSVPADQELALTTCMPATWKSPPAEAALLPVPLNLERECCLEHWTGPVPYLDCHAVT